MAQTALQSTSYSDDLVKWEVDLAFCREAYKIKNGTGAGSTALADVVGLPIKIVSGYAELVLAAGHATIVGLVISGPPLEALANGGISAGTYIILKRGPAMVNKSKIKLSDLASSPGTMTIAQAVAALAVVDIQCFKEPPISGTQLT